MTTGEERRGSKDDDSAKLALHLNNLLPDIWGARKMNYILFGELLLVSKEKFGSTIYDLCVRGLSEPLHASADWLANSAVTL